MRVSQWYRQLRSSDWWTEKAECHKRQELPWTGDSAPSPFERSTMASLCDQCPAIVDCARFALDNGATGGFYAGVWLPWLSEGRDNKAIRRHSLTILRKRAIRDQSIAAVQ
jgi:hypothetical protein